MTKPSTIEGYSDQVTADCERVLVTLLRNLGPWKKSIFLVGGLTPRYLVRQRPPQVRQHAGTLDLDMVIDLVILDDTEAYKTLEENLKKMGFENATNEKGRRQNWRWEISLGDRRTVILELLADRSEQVGGKVAPLPTEGSISALNIPHSSMVFDLHDSIDVTAELLGDEGLVTETVRYANIVSFVCLKALAFADRAERKDAHDLVYCIENGPGEIEAAAKAFRDQMQGKYQDVVSQCLEILERHFVDDERTEGYLKDGPTKVANFELETETRENRIRRQRDVGAVIAAFLTSVGWPLL